MALKLTEKHLAQLTDDQRREFDRARAVASWMDDRLKIGGFGVGLDGIVGIIPVAGDLLSASMAIFHLQLASKLRLGAGTMMGIVFNTLADFLIGAVPIVGDLLDFAFRSHRRNMKLIERRLAERLEQET